MTSETCQRCGGENFYELQSLSVYRSRAFTWRQCRACGWESGRESEPSRGLQAQLLEARYGYWPQGGIADYWMGRVGDYWYLKDK